MRLTELYRPSLGLLTDLYQVTMAYGYWKAGLREHEACFHLFFRTPPFRGGYALAAGLDGAVDFLAQLRFDQADITYLSTLEGRDGKPLFEGAFLEHLASLRFRCDAYAVPEGTVMFGNEPLLRVTGPIVQCQLVETPLLTLINFPSLIATKAARVCQAAEWDPVLEFGLRRAQGPDGGITAARAAYIGGCAATSNVMAGRLYGIPVRGTHAHSWVMSFGEDLPAFDAWAEAMPANCIFLVDTYDTLRGVEHAIEAGRHLRARGHEMAGIRLDSGDLAELSIQARKMLDEAGFPDARIVGSGDLDEHEIAKLKARGAKIGMWGVGTRLTTAFDDPALGGVYKLTAIRPPGGDWEPRLKRSDSPEKSTVPGLLQVRRFHGNGGFVADAVYDERMPPRDGYWNVLGFDDGRTLGRFGPDARSEDLLVPLFEGGEQIYEPPSLESVRERARRQLEALPEQVRRLERASTYPAGLESGLYGLRARLLETRETSPPTGAGR